ncbi:MAG: sigma-70 family RNA polymerase sigma factor [Sedimentisphaerales bacterium]|nr:sigma-70 family RNA polymerase sigma factor [Sedimentisphaerales bacterium]
MHLGQPDARLVERALAGDESAFAELYDRYARLVRAIARDGTNDLQQAQDLAQEVFLRAYSKLGELKNPDRFGYWLASIARNVARESRRSRLRERHLWLGEEAEELVDEMAEELRDTQETRDRLVLLAEAIAVLNDKERLALHSFYLQGQDIEQARRIVGVSRSSFYRLLGRAKERVEAYMREREGR